MVTRASPAVERSSADPKVLGPFIRWCDLGQCNREKNRPVRELDGVRSTRPLTDVPAFIHCRVARRVDLGPGRPASIPAGTDGSGVAKRTQAALAFLHLIRAVGRHGSPEKAGCRSGSRAHGGACL